jgi:hypothetical protein
LITNVPKIYKNVHIESTATWKGANVRAKFALLMIVPLTLVFDQNGGLLSLGMTRGTTMERQFKMRPDYASGRFFAAERQELPAFKTLI